VRLRLFETIPHELAVTLNSNLAVAHPVKRLQSRLQQQFASLVA
jgi:hypothetical protein